MRNIIFLLLVTLYCISSCAYSPADDIDTTTTCNREIGPLTINNPDINIEVFKKPWQQCTTYSIQIDGTFSAIKTQTIIDTWKVWIDIVGNHVNYKIYTDCNILYSQTPCVTKVFNIDPDPKYAGFYLGYRYQNGQNYSGIITLEKDMDEEDFRRVSIHEFGHSLGLDHSTNPTSIMQSSSNIAVPNCEDKINVCKIWGCTPICDGDL